MNKLNLKKNDIIVILVIFVVFCIFMYINTYNTYENFLGVAINYESKEVKVLNDFLDTFTEYLDKLKELNKSYLSFITFVKDDNTDFKSNVDNINNILNELRNIKHAENEHLFNDFFEIHHNHIFKENSNLVKICKKDYSYKKQKLERFDDNITNIDSYFNKLKLVDDYKNVMDLFSDYRNVLIEILKNKSVINECIYKKEIKKNYKTLKHKFKKTTENIENLKTTIKNIKNIKNINKELQLSSQSNIGDIPLDKLEFETKFCDKLKKLNKPNKSNIIFKRFTNDIIQQKMKYVKNLEDNIKLIQDQMTEKELNNYNLNKLRTNDHATKQYEAIKQAINNIKNRNKVKINLT
jgi:hypothetical protein